MAELNEELSQGNKSQQEEQQVYYNTLLAIYPYKYALVNYSTSTGVSVMFLEALWHVFLYNMPWGKLVKRF